MSRYTAAYSQFTHQLEEVEILRRTAASRERADAFRPIDAVNSL